MANKNYTHVRICCDGIIKGCKRCADMKFSEGYCPECGRPLWKNIGEQCNFILGYHEQGFKKQGKLHIKCKYCNTLTTL